MTNYELKTKAVKVINSCDKLVQLDAAFSFAILSARRSDLNYLDSIELGKFYYTLIELKVEELLEAT